MARGSGLSTMRANCQRPWPPAVSLACWKNACRWRGVCPHPGPQSERCHQCPALVQNWHSGGILDQTRSPANVPALEREAQRIAEHIIAALDYVGVLTVEFFLVGGELLVNEMAPGPTIRVIPASTTPVAASSSCRCAPCAICRCRRRLRCSPPSCSTCSGICGKTARRTGPAPWPCPGSTFTSMAGRGPPRPQDGPRHRHWPRLAGGRGHRAPAARPAGSAPALSPPLDMQRPGPRPGSFMI